LLAWGKAYILKVRGVEVRRKINKKSIKKRKSTWEGILASIFLRFWWIFGAKLGGKMDSRSSQKCTEKRSKKKGTKMAEKSLQDAARHSGRKVPGCRAGCRGRDP